MSLMVKYTTMSFNLLLSNYIYSPDLTNQTLDSSTGRFTIVLECSAPSVPAQLGPWYDTPSVDGRGYLTNVSGH